MRSMLGCAAVVCGGMLFSTAAMANGGICLLSTLQASGTWGFAGQGVATQTSTFAPEGPVVQSGTVTHVATGLSGQTISGTWKVTLTQSDSAGYHPNVQFGGTFQASTATCQGDFYVTSPVTLAQPAFHATFVDGGNELRTISLLPNLFVAYTSAKKL